MKATGIIRKVDDLGRIVIPKEIRRTMRIKDGDPLEIYTDKDGGVIFRKYSMMGALGEVSTELCDVLHKTTGRTVVITDRDSCIAVAGNAKKQLTDQRISEQVEQLLQARKVYQHKDHAKGIPLCDNNEDFCVETFAPVLSESDILGSVTFISQPEQLAPDEVSLQLSQAISAFLGRHMES